jgi:hypothetical protein
MRGLVFVCVAVAIFHSPVHGQQTRLSKGDFVSAKECGACHPEIYKQWTESMHSQSVADPVYRAVLEAVTRIDRSRKLFCLPCHAPVAGVTGGIRLSTPLDWGAFSALEAEGVTCDFCHTISGNENLGEHISVGAYVYPRTGSTEIKYGRNPDATSERHSTEASALLQDPRLCEICHKFKHPVRGIEVQDTYREWSSSPQARAGLRCQDCHMPAYAGTSAVGGKHREEIHAHVFAGGHTDMVKKAATVSVEAQIDEGRAEPRLEVTAIVTNSGAAHRIPTGIPGIREMWLQLEVLGSRGETVAGRKIFYGQTLVDDRGDPAFPWEAFKIVEDTRIAPGKSERTLLSVPLPSLAAGPFKIRAALMDRLLSEAMCRRLNLPVPEPIVMASAETTVPPHDDRAAGNADVQHAPEGARP